MRNRFNIRVWHMLLLKSSKEIDVPSWRRKGLKFHKPVVVTLLNSKMKVTNHHDQLIMVYSPGQSWFM